jgi:hypothetical protein
MNSHINSIYLCSDKDIELIYFYLKQWRKNLFIKEKLDVDKAKHTIYRAYQIVGVANPLVVFSKGMNDAINLINRNFSSGVSNSVVRCDDYQQLTMHLFYQIIGKSREQYHTLSLQSKGAVEILIKESELFEYICYGIYDNLYDITDYILTKVIDIESSHVNNCYLQYCIEQLKLRHDAEAWDILKTLNQECPYIIPLSKLCIVIEKPVEIYLNNELLPHAQNKPAMRFGDGSKVYYHHGTPFPDKYGDTPINAWQSEWILSEETDEYRSILIHTIGYKRFHRDYPNYDFWQDRDRLLSESINIIIDWQLYHYNQLYLKHPQTDDLKINADDAIKIIDSLPFKLPTELWSLYQYYNGGYQLTPGLYFYPLKQAIQALSHLTWIKSNTGYPFPLFRGNRDEIYYVLADDPEPTYSHVYCQFSDEEPVIYAECITSLIITIAQCYQEGAYYVAINEETGERSIEQDLDKIEPIFEKFNPDQIDTWRKIWKG